MKIKNFLLVGAIGAVLFGCGGNSGGGVSNTSKTIKGVALKADGTPFGATAKVLAVDANGNAATGTVDASGNYTVTLVSSASSGKKEKLVEGNSFLNVDDGTNSMNLVIANDQTNVNFNVVTAAASALIVGNSGANLATIFAGVKSVASAKDEKGTVSNAAVLAALKLVQALTTDDVKGSANLAIGAMFGYATGGKNAFDVDKFLAGAADGQEVVLLKAAAKVKPNILSSINTALNSSTTSTSSFLLNDPLFYKAIAQDLADDTTAASKTAFTDLINKVVVNQALKDALKTLETALDAYVVAVEKDITATFSTTTVSVAVAAPTVTVGVARSSDVITYSVTNGIAGDTTSATLLVTSGIDIVAKVDLKLTFDGTVFTAGSAVVTSDDVSVNISSTKAITAGKVDLAIAFAEAKAAMTAAKLDAAVIASIPTTSKAYSITVLGDAVTRSGVSVVLTFISSGATTASSTAGVVLP